MAGLKIRKGDRVRVLSGKDRGKEGAVMRAIPASGKVIVDGVNVALVCPSCGKPTRVGYKIDRSGQKARVCKKCGGEIT